MPRKHYFVLDSGKLFDLLNENPPPMNEDERRRYLKALSIAKENKLDKKSLT